MSIRFVRALGTAAVMLIVMIVSPLVAQGPPVIDIRPRTPTVALTVAARDVLTDKSFDELLRNGFPARLHFRAEIWTIEVPSLIFVVWAPIHASGVKASEPHASAVQAESKPKRSAVCAISTKLGWGCACQ